MTKLNVNGKTLDVEIERQRSEYVTLNARVT